MRFTTRTVGDRMHNAVKRVTVEETNEDPLFRESTLSLYAQEKQKEIEHMEPYGFTSRVKKPTGQQPNQQKAEGLMIFTGGNRSHGVLVVAGDRRYRLRGLKEGELSLFDDQGQQVHFTRDGIVTSAPNGKKIVAQIMKSNDPPKPQTSSSKAKEGQGTQASQDAYATFVLTKESLTITHPDKIVHTVGQSTLTMLPDRIEIATPTVSSVITKRFETVGPTFLGLDVKDEVDVQIDQTVAGPAKKTFAKV
jgi:phage gp45-like